jgi:outer membrane protein assembly factor BamB
VNTINHNEEAETIQIITPEIIWEPETNSPVTAKPVVHNNVVYTSTYGGKYDPVELAGFNIDTKQMVFHAVFGGPEDVGLPLPEGGGLENPIFIHGDTLYYLNLSIAAWNIPTGELLYRHVFTRDIPNEQYYGANELYQAVYYKEKIYYTSVNSASPLGFRNIHCMDPKTGTLAWTDVSKGSVTLLSNPIIAHDRLYVSQYTGFRVYNPENGKLIGVDKSFCGTDTGRNVLYNDYMICVKRNPKTMEGRMVAVYVGK